jgi:hypothetical protein
MGKHTDLGSAKRDDPIYSGGLMVHFKPPLTPSTGATLKITDGALPHGPKHKGQPSNSAPAINHPLDGEDISVRPSLIANGVPRDKWPQGKISLEQAAKLIAQYRSGDYT